MSKTGIFYFFIFSALISITSLKAQDTLILDQDDLEEVSKGVNYKFQEKEVEKDNNDQKKNINIDPGTGSWFNNAGPVFKVALIIIGIGIILSLLIWLVSNSGKSNVKNDRAVTILSDEEITEKTMTLDFDQLIKQAEDEGNYAYSLRLLYQWVIRILAENEYIIWKKDKTNHQFLNEIKDQEIKSDFRKITLIFEKYWYGEYPIDVNKYIHEKGKFNNLLKELNERQPG
ncbi:hypothetical protein OO013_08950 [Mangrovivirga sp. M17]|uniref:DUF4129 domain-containing protein n=1 Tax=Mangrovivirga halotolerans TaxID=2993936 RepID=A0ABT3RQC4_9BACT|nr:hypothetical protein [Mangrovivirga halotolerans]MCX2743990.1 hypothetical protein [Mangrovivirga halotolerans]